MPKLKTHKASKKRMKVTATGKVLVHPVGARHMLSGKSAKHRRHMRRMRPLKATDRNRVLRSLNLPMSKPASAVPPAPAQEPTTKES